ncbi:Cytochrome c oxidase subunit CcoN [Minicystis rosea]|nr:Cytochrome c oxidase subunit CcoN [Minicystis rosea]
MDTKPTEARVAGGETKRIVYNDDVVRWFIAASVIFALVGLIVGVVIALQLAFWQANVSSFLSFGRLRPLHTNAVIFAFVGNMLFAGIYHSSQRLLKTRMASDTLGKIHFWGWQLIIVAAAVTLPLGFTTGKEYAELEWPIDLAIAVVWVVFAINFFWTIAKRNEKHLYVAIWFYIATIVTVAVLHIVNSLEIPVSLFKSYSIYGGAKDALVQWWYGHNAVAFFLTTPILGIMYYYVPKAADRPVYSYRLSVIHFWALVFLYIWAGPHHLLNSALPDWAQTLGMVFSIMLWAPSWGGMVNGLLTLRGAWDKLREDPVLKFFAAGVTFYGMATFEGPLLSIKSVNGLAHYTDWIIGHVHSGALGWNGFMAAAMFYWMVPRLYGTKLHSPRLANTHFFLGTVGILLYMISMWVSGVTQGLMWRAVDDKGALVYPSFVETLIALKPMYWTRLFGGTLYLVGMILMAYNLAKTVAGKKPVEASVEVYVERKAPDATWAQIVFGRPMIGAILALTMVVVFGMTEVIGAITALFFALLIGIGTIVIGQIMQKDDRPTWHRILEGRAMLFTSITVLAVLAGGVAELIPVLVIKPAEAGMKQLSPYSALELEGRDIYLREGCYVCHSQMIRPFRWETMRYGEVSRLEDSLYDHPFQWGSKRTGPDLAREGLKYPNLWHYKHMMDPRSISEGSNMPPYAHMAEGKVDFSRTSGKLSAMKAVGVPYSKEQIASAESDAKRQAEAITKDLADNGATVAADTEIVAIIAYLQRLGRKAGSAPTDTAAPQTISHQEAR